MSTPELELSQEGCTVSRKFRIEFVQIIRAFLESTEDSAASHTGHGREVYYGFKCCNQNYQGTFSSMRGDGGWGMTIRTHNIDQKYLTWYTG